MTNMVPNEKDLIRFWAKVDKSGECWLWTSQLRTGYGIFRLNGKVVSAHRLSYSLENELVPGLQVCHACDAPACVRPSHLFQGTAKVNSDDKFIKDRGKTRFSNAQVEDMRSRAVTNTMVKDLAEEFNAPTHAIKMALTGEQYAWIPNPIDLPPQWTAVKLTQEQVAEVLEAAKHPYWGYQSALARKFGVTRTLINVIVKGRVGYATDTQNN